MKELLINQIYRELKPGSTRQYNYFIYRKCDTCGEFYYAKKSGIKFSHYCSSNCAGRVRGRPVGTQLSKYTKQKIADTRRGRKHSADTKESISLALHALDYSALPPKKEHKGSTSRKPDEWKHARSLWRVNTPRCSEWNDFIIFYKWIKDQGWESGLVISRTDKFKPFSPDNVVIRAKSEHSRTTRNGKIQKQQTTRRV